MTQIQNWLPVLKCVDCGNERLERRDDRLICHSCGRPFYCKSGIWGLLPAHVENQNLKDREKAGWDCKQDAAKHSGWSPSDAHYLSLPHHPHPYYQAAAWYLRIVMALGRPWAGKRVLELGAAECWATRHFAQAGAKAAALDYDPDRMHKGQILLDHLPIHFIRINGDAERLPFSNQSLDIVFCCSVLHHFFNVPQAISEIARVLKPGGLFLAIHEAFHPPYYDRSRILSMHEDTLPNIAAGINESSYTAWQYLKWFRSAGIDLYLLHPSWDVRVNADESLTVDPGIHLSQNPAFLPSSLTGRAWRRDGVGLIARIILKSRLWKIAAIPAVFKRIRFQILNFTTKDKIMVARKRA